MVLLSIISIEHQPTLLPILLYGEWIRYQEMIALTLTILILHT